MNSDPRLLLLSPEDSVFVLRDQVEGGETVLVEGVLVTCSVRLGLGQKIARKDLKAGYKIFKYGAAIGVLTSDIQIGDHVHLHNLRSEYTPTYALNGEGKSEVMS